MAIQENNELDIGRIFSILSRYWWSIALITLLFTSFVGVYAYFLSPIYSTSTLISIENKKGIDLSSLVPGASSTMQDDISIDSNIRILKSRSIISKVLDKVDLRVQYYVQKRYKDIEISYAPFDINVTEINPTINNTSFKIEKRTNRSFRLTNEKAGFDKIVWFGKPIQTKLFSLTVNKTSEFEQSPYLFKINADKTALTQMLINNVKINKPADDLLEIVYSDTIPNRAKIVADEIAKLFIQYRLDRKTFENEKTLKFLDKRLKFIRDTLKGYGNKLKDFQSKNSRVSAVKGGGENLITKLTTNEDRFTRLKFQLDALSQVKDKAFLNAEDIINIKSSGVSTGQLDSWMEEIRLKGDKITDLQSQFQSVSSSTTSNPTLSLSLQLLRDKKNLLKRLRDDYTSEHPMVIQTQKDIKRIKEDITQIESDLKNNLNSTSSYLQNSSSMLRENIKKAITTLYQNTLDRYNNLQKEIGKDKNILKQLPDVNMKLGDLKRNFTLTEGIYTFLLQKRMEVEISKASTIVNTKIIDEALIPTKPIKPNKRFLLASGVLVGLILGIALAFLRALIDNRIRDKKDISALTDIPFYGSVPDKKYKFAFVESFRTLRSNMQYIVSKHESCTVALVTSSIPKEGKTTISSNLAEVISLTANKVLVIDLDLRKPRLNEEFNVKNKKGITSYLSKKHSLDEVLIKVNEHLDLLPAGPVAPNPSELLLSDKFRDIISELMKKYDYIIMDTSPLGMVMDATILMKYADIVLMVVRSEYTEKNLLTEFDKLSKQHNINSIGLVLNYAPLEKTSGYGYGYGYGQKENEQSILDEIADEKDMDIEIEVRK